MAIPVPGPVSSPEAEQGKYSARFKKTGGYNSVVDRFIERNVARDCNARTVVVVQVPGTCGL